MGIDGKARGREGKRLGDTLQQVWDEGTAADVLWLLCCAPQCTSPSLSCTVLRPQPCSTPSCCHSPPSLPELDMLSPVKPVPGVQSRARRTNSMAVLHMVTALTTSPLLQVARNGHMLELHKKLPGGQFRTLSVNWLYATGRLQGGEQQGGQAGSSVSCALVTSLPCKAQNLAVPAEASCALSCGLLRKGSRAWEELGPKGCLSSGKDQIAPSPVPTHPMCLFLSRLTSTPTTLQLSLSTRPQACLQLPSHGISCFQTPWPMQGEAHCPCFYRQPDPPHPT